VTLVDELAVAVTVPAAQTIEVTVAPGPPGPAGQSTSYLNYQFKTATTTPPGPGELRANNANQTLATALYLPPATVEGNDATNILNQLAAGDKVTLQDAAAAGRVQRYRVNSTAFAGGYFTLAVTWLSGGGQLVNQVGNDRAAVMIFWVAA
jgi:hypothetical protein